MKKLQVKIIAEGERNSGKTTVLKEIILHLTSIGYTIKHPMQIKTTESILVSKDIKDERKTN